MLAATQVTTTHDSNANPLGAVPSEAQRRAAMGKRKRTAGDHDAGLPNSKAARPISKATAATLAGRTSNYGTTVQIVAGSYERALHGIIAHIPEAASHDSEAQEDTVAFADSFLFNAHTSSIRCLALSPPSDTQKVFLATGSTDERINIYSLTTVPPPISQGGSSNGTKPSKHTVLDVLPTSTAMNAANKEVGTLNHHAATVTSLSFPTRTKLLSGAADNSIAVLRTRDWEVLSSLRAPVPKPAGRPSGDTAAPGEVPAGINDVAIHPSLKLMLTVGRGEKCMRLWNLVTGKKAGVLQFDRKLLAQVGEGKYSSGEGRRALWDADGEAYAILFERGACIFGIDSKPKAVIRPQPSTKLHQIQYLEGQDQSILVASTEDGRLLFYNTSESEKLGTDDVAVTPDVPIASCPAVAQLGGREHGVPGRIKDFTILPPTPRNNSARTKGTDRYLAITATSDGAVQVWTLESPLSQTPAFELGAIKGLHAVDSAQQTTIPHIGNLIGTYATGSRITCLKAFVMDGKPGDAAAGADAIAGAENKGESSLDEDSDESE